MGRGPVRDRHAVVAVADPPGAAGPRGRARGQSRRGDEMETVEFDAPAAIDRVRTVAPHDQGFAEDTAAEDIDILLAGPLVAGSERGDGVGRRRRHGADEIGRDVAVAEIGEPVPVERFAKVQEGERFVDVFVEFMRQVGVAAAEHLSGFVAPDAAIGISAVALSRQRLDQRAAVKRLTVAFFAQSRVQHAGCRGRPG